ncbi:MAG: glutamate racemase [Acidimicrobiales bacterium]|nr:glutamate racemase [Acidimicrobiales bacterium]
MAAADRPVAMFDSGFGGLTVARAVIDLLPNEHVVYFGDTARYPYGPRTHDEVRDYAVQITEWLVETHDPKMIVVACNTASAVALEELEAMVDVPVIGVLEPGLRSLLKVTVTGRVAMIGTVGTVASGAYQRLAETLAPDVDLTCAACPGFVEFVERGETRSDQVHVLAERLLAPVQDAKVDSLLLGCTHYPFLARTIGDVMGRDVVLVSSADETAFEVQRSIEALGADREGGGPPVRRFVSSGDVETFARLGRQLLGPELDSVEAHQW